MNVRFLYRKAEYNANREVVTLNFCNAVARIIQLPDLIEVEFTPLEASIYGETILDFTFKNRLRINDALTPEEAIHALVHELIHIHQMHVGKLSSPRPGIIVWNKTQYRVDPSKMTYAEHQMLPWEVEVQSKQITVLNEVLRA